MLLKSEIDQLTDEELLNYHGRLHSYLNRLKNDGDNFNIDDISSQHYLVYDAIKNRDLRHKNCDEMDDDISLFSKVETSLHLYNDEEIERELETIILASMTAPGVQQAVAKEALTDDTINFRIIGRMKRSERFDTLGKEEPTEIIDGAAAYELYKDMSKNSDIWVLRCAVIDGDELVPINAGVSSFLTSVHMSIKWNTELRHPQWQGLDDSRLWEMDEGIPHREVGEYAYWKTIARQFDKEPKLGDTVSIRPARLQQYMGLGAVERYCWLQPTIMSAVTDASVDSIKEIEERGLIDIKGVVGKSMDSGSSEWSESEFIDEDEISKSVIPYKDLGKADENEEWDASEEVKAADVDTLKIICAWYDSDNADVKSSYKLPHHKSSGKNVAVWNGVKAAMGALLGARGGVDMPSKDKKQVFLHLKSHYKEFEKEVPEFVLKEYIEPVVKSEHEIACWVASYPIDKEPLMHLQRHYGLTTNDQSGQSGLHLTLACFDSLVDIEKTRKILSESDVTKFLFTPRVMDIFGDNQEVLVVRGDCDDDVNELVGKLRDCDSANKKFDFNPHITLGAVEDGNIDEVQIPKDIRFGEPVFMISRVQDVDKYRHSKNQCMHKGCQDKPKYQVLWAEGRANCWFCEKHLPVWLNSDYGIFTDVNAIKEVTTDEVPKWGDNNNPNIWEALREQLIKKG